MSASTILTFGYGSFGKVNFIPTLGYGNYGSTPAPVVLNLGAGGKVTTWKDHLQAVHEQRELERHLAQAKKEAKTVQRKIRAAEKKIAKAEPSKAPEGILANLWKLAERREELKLKINRFEQELYDLEPLITASTTMKEMDDDEDDVEALLLT